MKPPCFPLMGEGLGVRVRVPAVVTFPALVNSYQLSIEQASKNFWAGERNFLGGWLPEQANPSGRGSKNSDM
jgi:hypothetical protein